MNLKANCVRLILPGLLVLSSVGPLIGQSAVMTWPDAVARLKGERSQAETCVAVLKRYGTPPQIANGQLAYAKPKSDSDAVIAGLITALATKDAPANLPMLQVTLASSVSGLADFCNSVSNILSTAGEKGAWDALVKIVGIEPLVKEISDGVAALYNNYRNDELFTRRQIQTELEGARWPDFAKVEPVQ
jgi:hypothetical protein